MDQSPQGEHFCRLGIVGGGTRCRTLLEMIESGRFEHFKGSVVAVADIRDDAPGMIKAREMGIATTNNYGLLSRDDIDIIIELTGQQFVRNRMKKFFPPGEEEERKTINELLYELVDFQIMLNRTDEQLKDTLKILHTMVNSVDENIMALDKNYRIIDVNETMIKNLDLPKNQILGRYCYQITHGRMKPCEPPDHPCPLKYALETGMPARVSHKHYTKNGHAYHEIAHYPVKDKNGETNIVLEVATDISEIVNTRIQSTEKQLKSDYSRLVMEDKMISLGKLMASVVHEINNPLSGTLNLARLVASNLRDGIENEDQLQENLGYLDLVCSEIDRTSKIVSNLLFFSRPQPKEKVLVSIPEVMDRVLAIANHKINLQMIIASRDYEPDIPQIRFQAGQMDQMFMNIIFNSIEAMPDGGTLTIRIFTDKKTESAQISIRDNGYGIRKEDMLKVFEPFFSTKGEAKGVGLGLSVVHGIIRAHSGTIEFNSEPGKGTECIIKLPFNRQ